MYLYYLIHLKNTKYSLLFHLTHFWLILELRMEHDRRTWESCTKSRLETICDYVSIMKRDALISKYYMRFDEDVIS